MSSHRLTAILELRDRLSGSLNNAINRLRGTQRSTERARDELGRFVRQAERVPSVFERFRNSGVRAFTRVNFGAVSLVSSLAGVAAAVGGISLAAKALEATLGGAMRLEQEKISIEHFIGLTNPEGAKKATDEYVDYLRKNAAATPFDVNEVVAGGRRLINVTGGDLDSAKELLTISENMSALNPGKSLTDAVEALADMKVGETERMKEFGFKISADDMKAAGGGDVEKGAMKLMLTDVAKTFEGGADKLAASAYGKIQNITGALSGAMTDMGVGAMEKLKPLLQEIADFTESKQMEQIVAGGTKAMNLFADGVIGLYNGIKNAIPYIKQGVDWFNEWKQYTYPLAKGILFAVSAFMAFKGAIGILKGLKVALMFFTGPVGLLLGLLTVLYAAWDQNWGGMRDKLMEVWETIKPYVMNALAYIQNLFVTYWPVILEIFRSVWNFIMQVVTQYLPPIIQAIWTGIQFVINIFMQVYNYIASIMPMIMQIISYVWGWIGLYISMYATIIWNVIKVAFDLVVNIISTAINFVWNLVKLVFNGIATTIKAVLQVLTGDFAGAWNTIKEGAATQFALLKETIGEFVSGAVNIGKDFIDGIITGFLNIKDKLIETAQGIWDKITGIFKKKETVDVGVNVSQTTSNNATSHAAGIAHVPYDQYNASLHKGERVLTADQNRDYNEGRGGGGTVQVAKFADQIIVRNESDIDAIARALAKHINEAGGQMA